MNYRVGQIWGHSGSVWTISIVAYDPLKNMFQVAERGHGSTLPLRWFGEDYLRKAGYTVLKTEAPRPDPLDQAYAYGLPTVFDVADLEELRTSEAPRMSETKCECGSEKAGLGGHSSWCPKFQNLKESA